MCEHVLSDKMIDSFTCRTDNFHRLINRVCPPQELTLGGGFYIIIDVFLSVLSGRL